MLILEDKDKDKDKKKTTMRELAREVGASRASSPAGGLRRREGAEAWLEALLQGVERERPLPDHRLEARQHKSPSLCDENPSSLASDSSQPRSE